MSDVYAGEQDGAEVAPIGDVDFDAVHVQTTDDGARLIGSRCDRCATLSFPKRAVCFSCGSRSLTEALLASGGTLYSYSTVHISSARPVPYTIGYIDLDDGVRLLANIAGDIEDLRMDMPMALQAGETGFAFAAVQMGALA